MFSEPGLRTLNTSIFCNLENITYCTDRDDSPPETDWDRIEMIVRIVLYPFGIVDQRGEYDNSQQNKEDQKEEFLKSICQSLKNRLKPVQKP